MTASAHAARASTAEAAAPTAQPVLHCPVHRGCWRSPVDAGRTRWMLLSSEHLASSHRQSWGLDSRDQHVRRPRGRLAGAQPMGHPLHTCEEQSACSLQTCSLVTSCCQFPSCSGVSWLTLTRRPVQLWARITPRGQQGLQPTVGWGHRGLEGSTATKRAPIVKKKGAVRATLP